MGALVPIITIACIFVGMPWVILHYVTKWRSNPTLTREDEALLDQLYDTARRMDERLVTIERIVAAEHPDFRPSFQPSAPYAAPMGEDSSFDRRN